MRARAWRIDELKIIISPQSFLSALITSSSIRTFSVLNPVSPYVDFCSNYSQLSAIIDSLTAPNHHGV